MANVKGKMNITRIGEDGVKISCEAKVRAIRNVYGERIRLSIPGCRIEMNYSEIEEIIKELRK